MLTGFVPFAGNKSNYMHLNLSSIVCLKRTYEFSDASIVQWTPDDDSQKAHGMFTVRICLKYDGVVRVVCWHKTGPPSEAASLHLLKHAIKDFNK